MTTCNICRGKVEYIPIERIYGRSYGSGWCYRCTQCGAYVGTHINNPKKPLGILANENMRELRKMCHAVFDKRWNTAKERSKAYADLADKLGIKVEDCHFAMFDEEMLRKALLVLLEV